jgi:hypothetical protein
LFTLDPLALLPNGQIVLINKALKYFLFYFLMFACSINVDIVYKIKPTLQLFGIRLVMWALLNAPETKPVGLGTHFTTLF